MSQDTANIRFQVSGQAQLAQISKELRRQTILLKQIRAQGRTMMQPMAKEMKTARTASQQLNTSLVATQKGVRSVGVASRTASTATKNIITQETLTTMGRFSSEVRGGIDSLNVARSQAYMASRDFALLSRTIAEQPIRSLKLFANTTALARMGITRTALATAALREALSFVAASRFGVIAAGFAGIAAAGMAIRETVEAFRELDEQVRRVMSTMVFDTEVMTSYAKVQREIAHEMISFGKSAEDVGTVFWELKSAGLSAADATNLLDTNLKLLYTEVDDISTLTRMTAGIWRSYREELMATRDATEAAAYMGDILAYAMNQSQVDADSLTQGFKHSTSAALAAGIAFEDLTAMLMVLNNEMIMGGMAGRGVRVSMSQLVQDMEFLADRFDLVYDKSRPLGEQIIPILGQLHETIGDDAMAMEEFGLFMEKFGLRGAPSIMALVREFDQLNEHMDAMKTGEIEGSLDAIAKTNMEAFNAQWERFKNTAKISAAYLSDDLMQGLKIVFEGISDIAEVLTAPLPESGIVKFFADAAEVGRMFGKLFGPSTTLGMMGKSRGLVEMIFGKESDEIWADFKSLFGLIQKESKDTAEYIREVSEETASLGVGIGSGDFGGRGRTGDAYMAAKTTLEDMLTIYERYNVMVADGREDWELITRYMEQVQEDIKATETVMKGIDRSTEEGIDAWDEQMDALIGYKKEYADLSEMISERGEKERKIAEELKADYANLKTEMADFALETGKIDSGAYLAFLKESRDAVVGTMADIGDRESSEFYDAVRQWMDLEREIYRTTQDITEEKQKQLEEQKKLNAEAAETMATFVMKGGDLDEGSLRRRISYLTTEKYRVENESPEAQVEIIKSLIEAYTELGEVTGTDYFKPALLRELNEELRKTKEEDTAIVSELRTVGEMMSSVFGETGTITTAKNNLAGMKTPLDEIANTIEGGVKGGMEGVNAQAVAFRNNLIAVNEEVEKIKKNLLSIKIPSVSTGQGGDSGSVQEALMMGE
ncbi:MAG: phage tail tape measure protein [Deltaproteobacteria bacterium]|nr:phage tail tape measure protein [Candidatus Zymogenaceae bacterium]